MCESSSSNNRAAWRIELTLCGVAATCADSFSISVYPAGVLHTGCEFFNALDDLEEDEKALVLRSSSFFEPNHQKRTGPIKTRKFVATAQFVNGEGSKGGTLNGGFDVADARPRAECLLSIGNHTDASAFQAAASLPRANAYVLVLRGKYAGICARFLS